MIGWGCFNPRAAFCELFAMQILLVCSDSPVCAVLVLSFQLPNQKMWQTIAHCAMTTFPLERR